MALFKNKEPEPKDPPVADPNNPDVDEGAPKYVTVEQFDQFNKTLETVNKTLETIGQAPAYQQPAAPAEPAVDPHATQKARIVEIDKQLGELAKKADDATVTGTGMGEVMTQQNKLNAERSEVQGQMLSGQTDPRIDAGFQTLDALSTEITSGKMAYLALPDVKTRYEYYINQMLPEQRMNPEAKMGAYNLAVGENLGVIEEAKKQEWLREAEEDGAGGTQAPAGGGPTGRQAPAGGGGGGGPITPEDVFSPEALRSIKQSRHRTVDSYVRSLGYKDWDDYAELNKDHLGLEEEEQNE